MKTLRVVAPMGATVAGPAKVRLSADQHARRAGVLGPKVRRDGVYSLTGDQRLTFKAGEVIGLESTGLDQLNIAMFEDMDAIAEADTKAVADAAAKAEADAKAAAAAGAAS